MKITIDSDLKLILTNSVNLGELMDFLKLTLPDSWREYSITATPTYVLPKKAEKRYPDDRPTTYPPFPWWKPGLYHDDNYDIYCYTDQQVMLPSRFNFEVNEKNPSQEVN